MPTPALRELQGDVWRAIADTPGTNAAMPALLAVIEPSPGLTPVARLQVYVDAYFGRLQGVLRENFPRLGGAVSSERFAELVQQYLKKYPSEHPSISYVGRCFPAFLATQPDLPDFLAELANLEWVRAEVFEAEDATPLAAKALREVPADEWPALRFFPIPALRVLRATHAVHQLWADESLAVPAAQPTTLRVWRAPDWKVWHAPMDERESAALERLHKGSSFATLCEVFTDLPEAEAAGAAIALLLRWLEDGIVAAPRGPAAEPKPGAAP